MTTSFLEMPWRDSTFVLGIVVIAGFIPVGTKGAYAGSDRNFS
jgi:hypothetical protein